MTIPEKIGMVRLSLIFSGNSSMSIAASAPRNSMIGGSVWMVNITTPKETIKPASPPVNVLSPTLPNGKSLPIIAANESPIAKKIKAETAIAISKENTVMVHPKEAMLHLSSYL